MIIKPLLAENIDLKNINGQLYGQPKIDGVRGYNPASTLLGRSLKQHENIATTAYFSRPELIGFDGELHLGEITTLDNLCTITSSALSTITGTPDIHWTVFDYITEESKSLPYNIRFAMLELKVKELNDPRIHLIENRVIDTIVDVMHFSDECIERGFEGTIYRNPYALHKEGRSTRNNELLRLKHFIEEEALVLDIIEGSKNINTKQINELGRSFRTTHKDNMVPNAMVGTLVCKLLKDIYWNKRLLFKEGLVFDVAPGKMSAKDRIHYLKNPSELINNIIKFKTFPRGVKDLPRFPTFQSIRIKSDIGE